jgi:hypothetical protein
MHQWMKERLKENKMIKNKEITFYCFLHKKLYFGVSGCKLSTGAEELYKFEFGLFFGSVHKRFTVGVGFRLNLATNFTIANTEMGTNRNTCTQR